MKIAILVRSLDCGGTERQIVLLARKLGARHKVAILTFYDGEDYFSDDDREEVARIRIGKQGRWDILPFLFRYVRRIKELQPDVLYAFLSTPALASLVVRAVRPSTRIVWGVRASSVDFKYYDRFSYIVRVGEKLLSRYADLIISNSNSGKEQAVREGFQVDKIVVIPNGIDTAAFTPNGAARRAIRERWGVGDGVPLVGIVARHDPMKGYETFLHAGAQLAAGRPDVRFVSVGDGATRYTAAIKALADALGLGRRMIWAGRVDDVASLYSAFDLYTSSSSFGEGFSNSVGEAMACAVPCVVTDVGDSALIVGDTGIVVPADSPRALADGWCAMLARLSASPGRDGERARRRIIENFSVERMVSATEQALERLVH